MIQDVPGRTLTDNRNFTIPGVGWILWYGLIASFLITLGLALLLKTENHKAGVIILQSVLATSALVMGGVFIYYRFNRKSYDLQALIRVDVLYIKNLPETLSEDHLVEANRRIRHASKLSRNALRSTGFFFLFVGGCFVLADELHKMWPAIQCKITRLSF